jgi:hypothetical protein
MSSTRAAGPAVHATNQAAFAENIRLRLDSDAYLVDGSRVLCHATSAVIASSTSTSRSSSRIRVSSSAALQAALSSAWRGPGARRA